MRSTNWLNSEAFSLFGDNEINKLVEQFKPLYSTEERVNIKMEWLSYKTFGLAKVKQFKADYKNVCGTDELQCSDEGDDDTDGCDSDDDEIENRLAPKKPVLICLQTGKCLGSPIFVCC